MVSKFLDPVHQHSLVKPVTQDRFSISAFGNKREEFRSDTIQTLGMMKLGFRIYLLPKYSWRQSLVILQPFLPIYLESQRLDQSRELANLALAHFAVMASIFAKLLYQNKNIIIINGREAVKKCYSSRPCCCC